MCMVPTENKLNELNRALILTKPTSYADPNSKHYQSKDQENDGASPCKLGSNTRNLENTKNPPLIRHKQKSMKLNKKNCVIFW